MFKQERRYCWPEGHWDWLIHLSHKHGIRCGNMIFLGGQVDKDSKGLRLHPHDLDAQTEAVMGHIKTVLAGLDAGMEDVVKLVAFYVNNGDVDERALMERIGRHVDFDPGPVITMVPLPGLAYPEMMVEIEAVAMLGEDNSKLPKTASRPAGMHALPGPFSHGIRCGQMIYAGAQVSRDADGKVKHPGDILAQTDEVMKNLEAVLKEYGADLDDSVKFNILYRAPSGGGHWEAPAVRRASYFKEPGPVATGLPVPWLPDDEYVRMEVWAMLGEDGQRLPREYSWPEGHWDWFVHLPYRHGLKCGNMVFVGGQVSKDPQGKMIDPDDIVGQTHRVMDNVEAVLGGFGLTMDHMVKQNAFYRGEAHADAIVSNQKIRTARYTEPAGASTGVPFRYMGLEGMAMEVEIIAME
ncbi:MAG: RidA family protein [Proteobacteria bacterium]|nr:RidA family protein [Pseudomonadota bacterium]